MNSLPLVAIATAWGPRHGGINAFNADLCMALAKRLGSHRPVVCVIIGPEEPAIQADAGKAGVTLIATGHAALDSGTIITALRKSGFDSVAWWIGHDVTTGRTALLAKEAMGQGQVALIHHMAFRHYAGHKHGSGAEAIRRHAEQEALFRQADRCFAVGPKLRDNLITMLDDGERRPEPAMLIPGLVEGVRSRKLGAPFRAMVFGRLSREDDAIKQGRLAVAAMAEARAHAMATAGTVASLRGPRPTIDVVGIDAPGSETERSLLALSEKRGGSGPPLVTAQPFLEDRAKLFHELAGAHLALMPSWHEGFGLTGWEAVAAGVPLILSKESGLYQLLAEETPGLETGCVYPVEVGGHQPSDDDDENFTDKDVDTLKTAILNVAAEHDQRRKSADTLRKALLAKGMTWETTATVLLGGLGLNDPPPGGPPPTPPTAPPPGNAASPPMADAFPATRRESLPTDREFPGSLLLRPEYQVVPFQDFLEPVVADILAWASDEAQSRRAVALRHYAADGGSGKTRLMIEICNRLRDRTDQEWKAGFIPDGRRADALEREVEALVKGAPRVFLVMDYAETRRKEVLAVAGAMLRAPAGHRIRLVLLARGRGEWWDHLRDDATNPSLRSFLGSDAAQGPLPLLRLDTADTAARTALYQAAQDVFRGALKDHDPLADPPAPTPDLAAAPFRQVLFLHLAALAALHGRSLQDEDELLDTALDRERDYWKRSLDDDGLDPGALDGVAQAMAMLTLVNGTSTAREARAVLTAAPRLSGMGEPERNRLFDRLHALYPRGGGIDALRPDLLGEHLVRRVLRRDDEVLDRVLDLKGHPDWAAPALTVLTRLAQRKDPQWLRRAMRPEGLSIAFVERAMEVAVEVGDPLGLELGNAIDQAEPRIWTGIVNHIWPKLPEETVALSTFSEIICKRKIETLERKEKFKSNGKGKDYISALMHFSRRIYQNGNPELALSTIQSALEKLNGSSEFDIKEKHKYYADILSNLSVCYSGIGKYGEALEAVEQAEEMHRKLAKARPGVHRADWATSLSNLGSHLSEVGRHDEALKATEQAEEMHRELAKARPDVYRADWETSLSNLGSHLSKVGRHDEALKAAEQAEEIRRELAAARPDAHRADWATSLSNLGSHLSNAGRHDEALEAAQRAEEIRRELAAVRPDAHRADWATSLSNLGSHLSDVGRYDEALQTAERAEEIRRELAAARPEVHRVSWLISLGNRAAILLELGRSPEAQSAAQRATDLFADLPDYLHRRHTPTLGWCTTLLAESLLAQGAIGPASSMADMALTVFANAGTMQPSDVQPNKAVATAIRSRQPGLPRSEAERLAREALDLIAPHARRQGRGLWRALDHVATALRAAAPAGAADPLPPDLAAILDAGRPVTAPA